MKLDCCCCGDDEDDDDDREVVSLITFDGPLRIVRALDCARTAVTTSLPVTGDLVILASRPTGILNSLPGLITSLCFGRLNKVLSTYEKNKHMK